MCNIYIYIHRASPPRQDCWKSFSGESRTCFLIIIVVVISLLMHVCMYVCIYIYIYIYVTHIIIIIILISSSIIQSPNDRTCFLCCQFVAKGGTASVRIQTQVSLSLYIYIYIYTSLSLSLCIYIYINMYVCIYVYIHIISMHTNYYTHITMCYICESRTCFLCRQFVAKG